MRSVYTHWTRTSWWGRIRWLRCRSLPLKFEPPFRDPILDATGPMPDTWVSWFTRTSDRLADHETRITGLETRMTAAEAAIVVLQGNVVTLQTEVTQLHDDLVAVQGEVASILSRLAAAGIP